MKTVIKYYENVGFQVNTIKIVDNVMKLLLTVAKGSMESDCQGAGKYVRQINGD